MKCDTINKTLINIQFNKLEYDLHPTAIFDDFCEFWLEMQDLS